MYFNFIFFKICFIVYNLEIVYIEVVRYAELIKMKGGTYYTLLTFCRVLHTTLYKHSSNILGKIQCEGVKKIKLLESRNI